MDSERRELTDWERQVLDRLLSVSFEGSEELRRQIPVVRVTAHPERDLPSVGLRVDHIRAPAARSDLRVPVQAIGKDADGMEILFLLHVDRGYIRELEIFRGDSGGIQAVPPPQTLVVEAINQ